jgi:PEP-CTERM motif
MTLRGFVLVLALMVPSAAMADPITVSGVWSPTMTAPSSDPNVLPLESTAFWSNPSWDGSLMGVAYLIDAFTTANLEYLHNSDGTPARFMFSDEEQIVNLTFLFGITSRTGGVFGINEFGAFTYDSGYGPISNSWDNGEQFALFRLVGEETTRYFLGIEDILLSEYTDRDYNDYVLTFETQPVPEPGTLLLFGAGMATLVAQRRRAARKARSEATN